MRDWRTVPVREGIYSFSHLVDKESGSGEGCVEYQVVIVHFFFLNYLWKFPSLLVQMDGILSY